MCFLRNGLALDRQNPFFGSSEGDHIEYDEPEGKRVGPATPIIKEKRELGLFVAEGMTEVEALSGRAGWSAKFTVPNVLRKALKGWNFSKTE